MVAAETGISMKYVAPRNNCCEIPSGSVDMVIPQAVMEYVDDVPSTYKLSHTIDFKSHGFASDWNGHWTIPGRYGLSYERSTHWRLIVCHTRVTYSNSKATVAKFCLTKSTEGQQCRRLNWPVSFEVCLPMI
jgi:hypothetical protein